MDFSELDRIEARLGLSLPAEYREFVTNYPPDLERFSEYEVADSAAFVIDETERLRLEAPRRSRDRVVIGHSGCGDYYCLDLAQWPPPVLCLDHEAGRGERAATSFRAFVEALRRRPGPA